MHSTLVSRRPTALAVLAGMNVALGAALGAGANRRLMLVVAILPVLLIVAGALIASNRSVLVYAALALDLSGILPFRRPLIGSHVFVADLIVVLALASWLAAWLIAPGGRRPSWPRTPLLGLPLVVFALFIGVGIVRGHLRWGESLFSQPLRFVLYAGIAAALSDLTPSEAWRGLVAVFYLGAFSNAVAAIYYIATGTVQLEATSGLSTGGHRVLTLTTALYLIGALVLALLNFEREQQVGRRLLHLAVAVLAGFGIVVSYGRGIFYTTVLVLLGLLLMRSRLRGAVLPMVPLLLAALVLGGLFSRGAPGLVTGVVRRATTTTDPSTEWRKAANASIWQQVHEDPLFGVGFGKGATFVVGGTTFVITQDPHDSYLFLWAGGGIMALGSFLFLYLLFAGDAWRRYRFQPELNRALIAWCVALWFCFALNTLVEPQLTQPNSLLVLWILMLLPTVVPFKKNERARIAPA